MNAILGFKNLEEDDTENCPCGVELREKLNTFHSELMTQVSLSALQEATEITEEEVQSEKPSKYHAGKFLLECEPFLHCSLTTRLL